MWFDIAENYSCKLVGYDTVQFGRRPRQSDIAVRCAAARRHMAFNDRLCLFHQREDKVMYHEAGRSLPTNARLRMSGDIPQSPYVFIV